MPDSLSPEHRSWLMSRIRSELRKLGWRVLVVWECELMKSTVATVEKTAAWLRDDGSVKLESKKKTVRYDDSSLDRRTLLSVAEVKVEYRLSKGRRKPLGRCHGAPRNGACPSPGAFCSSPF